MKEVESESIRIAMDEAWRDHQHTRDQTWKALQIEFFIIAGVIGANWQLESSLATIAAVIFVLVITLCGIQITLRHRNKVEITKFEHITNYEEALGLHQEHLISDVKLPEKITIRDVFNPKKGNTSLFILRMHFAILGFALFILLFKLFSCVWFLGTEVLRIMSF